MKTSMKKALSLVLVFCTLFACVIIPGQVITASAAEQTVTLDCNNSANRVSQDKSSQVWAQNGITMTNNKGASSNDVVGNVPPRIYKNSDLTIAYPNMTKIVLNCQSGYSTVPTGLTGATATSANNVITITLNSPADSFTFNVNGSQLRITKVTVTATIADNAPTMALTGNDYVAIDDTITISAKTTNVTEAIVWTSSNTDVATVDQNGVVTGVAMGSADITASANGIEVKKNVKVIPTSGTISIATALEICKVTGSTNTPITYNVKGVIKSIDTAYDSEYGNITVTITDGTDSIKAYRLKGGSDLKVGDTITVTGVLVTYGTTPEFAQGCTFTKDEDDTLDTVQAELDAIAAYMSLAYKYSAITTTETVTSVTITDTLNRGVTDITGTSYGDWSGKTLDSGATYKGQSAGGNDSIQLRSNNSNSGIVTTVSGGKVAKIKVVWNSNTANGRTLDIYGKNTAYTAATELYGSNAGTKLGSIVCGTSTELVITGDYEYIGLRSNSGAMYIESIEIEWTSTAAGEGGTEVTTTTYSDSAFAIRCAVDAKLADISNVTAYGIKVSAGDKEVYYTADASSWTVDGDLVYIVLNLGDIINDIAKLGTKFTVAAFVEYNGVKLVSTNVKTHSVASMINEYYTNPDLQITKVEHLYNYLVENDLI